ncbi:MAG: hypothetical protein ACC613_04705 [Synergistales bacterium]|jgi:ElaB/YqjD/DUF883 family membrane-anchored ribosome-binding protein
MGEHDLQMELESLKGELGKLRTDLEELKGPVKGIACALKENLAEALGSGFEKAKVSGKKAVEVVETTVEEKPLQSVLVAFGVGLLLGKLIDMSHRR